MKRIIMMRLFCMMILTTVWLSSYVLHSESYQITVEPSLQSELRRSHGWVSRYRGWDAPARLTDDQVTAFPLHI